MHLLDHLKKHNKRTFKGEEQLKDLVLKSLLLWSDRDLGYHMLSFFKLCR